MQEVLTISKLDNSIISFFKKHNQELFVALITLFAILFRYLLRSYESPDFKVFLSSWCEYLEHNGRFMAIPGIDSDYNVSYLYILSILTYLPHSYLLKIKLVSCTFDVLCAALVGLLLKSIRKSDKNDLVPLISYTIVLFLPTVVMNSAVWAQCDSIYTTFVMLSIFSLVKEKYSLSFVFLGIALAFKLQTIFILPLFIYLYFKSKKFSFLNFFIIIFINIIVYLPSFFLGKSFKQIFSAYTTQTQEYQSTTLNFPNIYNLLPQNYQLLSKPGIILTCAIVLTILFILIYSKDFEITTERIFDFSLLFIIVCTCFLPAMHERYGYMADILAVIYLFQHKKRFYIPLGIWALNSSFYISFLFGINPCFDIKISSVIYITILTLLCCGIYKDRKNKLITTTA